jgi:hypothetical protein
MEVYERETEEVLRRYRSGLMTHPECVAALDDALSALKTILTQEQLREAADSPTRGDV